MGRSLVATASFTLPRQTRPLYDYAGIERSGSALQFYGMFHDRSSIPNVCGALATALAERIDPLTLHSYTGPCVEDAPLRRRDGVDPRAPVALFYGIPDAAGPEVWRHATRIIGLACESDRVPRQWVDCCNRGDLVFVPSRYCARSLRDSGVRTPVMVVPHGLEPCYRPAGEKARTTPFTFYNVVNADRPERKSLPELLRAFVRAFPGRDDVVLELRVARSHKVRRILHAAGVADDDPRIRILPDSNLPAAEFAAWYSRVHCTVHPSRAEGFGLIPLQSIACETPVIAPAHTGMADYLDSGNALLLDALAETREADVYYGTGTQPVIDEDHLVELLRRMERDWESEYARVRAAAADLRRRYTWQAALAPFVDLVARVVALDNAPARRALIAGSVG